MKWRRNENGGVIENVSLAAWRISVSCGGEMAKAKWRISWLMARRNGNGERK
jgi:hypothetical protein